MNEETKNIYNEVEKILDTMDNSIQNIHRSDKYDTNVKEFIASTVEMINEIGELLGAFSKENDKNRKDNEKYKEIIIGFNNIIREMSEERYINTSRILYDEFNNNFYKVNNNIDINSDTNFPISQFGDQFDLFSVVSKTESEYIAVSICDIAEELTDENTIHLVPFTTHFKEYLKDGISSYEIGLLKGQNEKTEQKIRQKV